MNHCPHPHGPDEWVCWSHTLVSFEDGSIGCATHEATHCIYPSYKGRVSVEGKVYSCLEHADLVRLTFSHPITLPRHLIKEDETRDGTERNDA